MGNIHRQDGKVDQRRKIKAPLKKCLVCKKNFYSRREQTGKKGGKVILRKYCGQECWSVRGRKINRCQKCNKMITTYQSQDKKYCDLKCRNDHYKVRFIGENSHFWEGGKTEANKLIRTRVDFKNWREAVFKRDNHTCQDCGARSGLGKRIEIHPDHIKPLSQYPELAYELSNGRTLCRPCHMKTPTWGNQRAKA